MASTWRARAISLIVFVDPLNCITDVREITVTFGIVPSTPINSSVIPSAKYSWRGSAEALTSGRTATERRPEAATAATGRRSRIAGHATMASSTAATPPPIAALRAHRRGRFSPGSGGVTTVIGGVLSASVSSSAASSSPALW